MQQLLPNCHTLLHAAWWGYANADDEARLEALLRRSSKLGFRADTAPTLTSICAGADDKLFRNVLFNDLHLLYRLLPTSRDNHYNLRSQTNHNLQLPVSISSLNDRNVFMRLHTRDIAKRFFKFRFRKVGNNFLKLFTFSPC